MNENVGWLSLDGVWEVGEGRRYWREARVPVRARVPGLPGDPARVNADTVWYKRRVELPAGAWSRATLQLNGARFCPAVFVNGRQVSQAPGGMAPTFHLLDDPDVRPGGAIDLEIALKPLSEVDPRDASRIPKADLWRSNVSSYLWDLMTLRLTPLARCGKNLTRTPVVQIHFTPPMGTLLVSQLLTRGRLAQRDRLAHTAGPCNSSLYALRYDPAAVQLTLNLLAKALGTECA